MHAARHLWSRDSAPVMALHLGGLLKLSLLSFVHLLGPRLLAPRLPSCSRVGLRTCGSRRTDGAGSAGVVMPCRVPCDVDKYESDGKQLSSDGFAETLLRTGIRTSSWWTTALEMSCSSVPSEAGPVSRHYPAFRMLRWANSKGATVDSPLRVRVICLLRTQGTTYSYEVQRWQRPSLPPRGQAGPLKGGKETGRVQNAVRTTRRETSLRANGNGARPQTTHMYEYE